MNPLVSIIIPAYNAELYIQETIESVLSQSYSNWELLIINDGSTDATEDIIKEFVKKDERIKLINQPNAGQGAARNTGIKNSNGKLIAFLDSDDLWEIEKLHIQVNVINQYNVGLVYTAASELKDKKKGKVFFSQKQGIIPAKTMLTKLYEWSDITNSSVLIKKEIVDHAGCFNAASVLRGTEDYDMWLKVAGNGYDFYFIDTPLTIYRIHEANTSSNRLSMINGVLQVYHTFDKNPGIPDKLRKQKYRSYYREKIKLLCNNKVSKDVLVSTLKELQAYDDSFSSKLQFFLFNYFPSKIALVISQIVLYRMLDKII